MTGETFMLQTIDAASVAHAIQLAVAPVFLMSGIGAILGVLANRLARVVDRLRLLEGSAEAARTDHAPEISALRRRARWIHAAVTLCTLSALLICLVIAALFIGSEIGRDPARLVALLFVSAMLALISGLLCFLREITIATGSLNKRK